MTPTPPPPPSPADVPRLPKRAAPLSFTARCPEDLLAMLPLTLGFVPHDSVAMLTFGASHPFHARVDLPTRPEDVPDLVESLLRPARSKGVRRLVLVFYTEDTASAERAWHGLRPACAAAGIQVLEVLRADGSRWFPMLDRARPGASVGFPYDVSAHPFRVESVLQGRVTHASRDDLAAVLLPWPEGVEAVRAVLVHGERSWLEGCRSQATSLAAAILSEGAWLEDLLARHVAAGSRASDEEVARVLHALPVRLLQDAVRAGLTREDAPEHVAFWVDVVRRTPRERLAAPAAVLAWAAWQSGDGAFAWCALDVAASQDPDHPLACEVEVLLTEAVAPTEWREPLDWRAGLAPPAA